MTRQVYSEQLAARSFGIVGIVPVDLLPGSPGDTIVVRDISCSIQGFSGGDQLFITLLPSGYAQPVFLLELPDPITMQGLAHWQGRLVLKVGDLLQIQPATSDGLQVAVVVSGYMLTP